MELKEIVSHLAIILNTTIIGILTIIDAFFLPSWFVCAIIITIADIFIKNNKNKKKKDEEERKT